MLNILINNESIRKSYKKSQRILSKFLPQLGQRTFCGSISQEGLKKLTSELKLISSKYMSISCLSIKNKHNTELLWILGNKDNFDNEDGTYAMKTKNLIKKPLSFIEESKEKYFNSLIKISALFHDLGKANNDFQSKLLSVIEVAKENKTYNSYQNSEFFRHETVSVFLTYLFFEYFENNKLLSFDVDSIKNGFDYSLIKTKNIIENNDFNYIQNYFFQLLNKIINSFNILNNIKLENKIVKKSLFVKNISEQPNNLNYFEISKISILWLVLTHHKLIGVKHFDKNLNSYNSYFNNSDLDNSPFYNNFNYIAPNSTEDKKFQKDKLLKLKNNFSFNKGLPSNNNIWVQNVVKELNDIFYLNNLNKDFFNDDKNAIFYLSTLSHYCRPFLVFSDYLGSVVKTKIDESKTYLNKDHLSFNFANLDNGDFGDTLDNHLITVKNSFRNLSHLFKINKNYITNEFLPYLNKNETKKLNEKTIEIAPDQFEWQNTAFRAILKESETKNKHSFTVVISETGSGKTMAGAKIMKAISNHELRYTLCLGLRTLTLQSGKSYRDDLGLNDKQVGIIIGSELSQKIYEKNNLKADIITGSDILDSDTDDYVVDFYNQNNKWKEVLNSKNGLYESSKLFDKQCSKIIDSPILVCTVDQLIGITNLNKVNKAKLIPRIFSSDLLLDEIDNYSPKDLIHVGRLIYLYGFYGRKVVIMSATVSRIIIEQLYESYINGLKCFEYLNGIKKPILLNLISNLTSPKIFEINLNSNISSNLDEFINDFILSQEKTISKLKLNKVINIDNSDFFNPIYSECLSLHDKFKNNIRINENNINISVGFIKFNNVNSARQMAYQLLTKPDSELHLNNNKRISVLCYHSKYTPLELDNIEIELNNVINRKIENSFSKNSQINSIINKNNLNLNNSEEKDLIIIICTTSILEVGRDHDYDWTIIEPSTNKSLIQSCGRVLRHRKTDKPENRVSVLSTMIKDKIYKEASNIWKNNGVFNYIKNKETFKHFENETTFNSIFDHNDYSMNIFTSIMFKNNNNNHMKILEDETYKIYLKDDNKSLNSYLIKKEWLNNFHYFNNKFRKKESLSEQGYVKLFEQNYYRNNNKIFYIYSNNFYYTKNIESINWNPVNSLIINNLKNERIFLNKYLIHDIVNNYHNFTDYEINLLTTYDIEYYDANKDINEILDYHPLLGFNHKKIIT